MVPRRRAARRAAGSAGPLRAGGTRGAAPGTEDGVQRREAVNSRACGPPVTSGETDRFKGPGSGLRLKGAAALPLEACSADALRPPRKLARMGRAPRAGVLSTILFAQTEGRVPRSAPAAMTANVVHPGPFSLRGSCEELGESGPRAAAGTARGVETDAGGAGPHARGALSSPRRQLQSPRCKLSCKIPWPCVSGSVQSFIVSDPVIPFLGFVGRRHG